MTDLMFRIRYPASPCFLREIFIAPFPFTVSIFLTRESIKSGRHMWLGKKAPNIFVIPAVANISLTLESRCPRRSPPTARHSSTPSDATREPGHKYSKSSKHDPSHPVLDPPVRPCRGEVGVQADGVVGLGHAQDVGHEQGEGELRVPRC